MPLKNAKQKISQFFLLQRTKNVHQLFTVYQGHILSKECSLGISTAYLLTLINNSRYLLIFISINSVSN